MSIYYVVYGAETLILFFYIDFLVIGHYSCLCIYVIFSFVTWLESSGKYIYLYEMSIYYYDNLHKTADSIGKYR